MPSLKSLRNRIRSVQSTRKITSAMKVVAASRLRRAQEAAETTRPYAQRMERMLLDLAATEAGQRMAPLLAGNGRDHTVLLVVLTSDRGLAGGFNSSILRETRRQIRELRAEGRAVKLVTVGRKGRDALRRDFGSLIVDSHTDVGKKRVSFEEARDIAAGIVARFEAGEFDVCRLIFNAFRSAISQVVTTQQLIPFGRIDWRESAPADENASIYEFEPSEEELFGALVPANLAVQIFASLLESSASEQGARMTAMDNATRNAGDMINKLTLVYNRTRQAAITKELIEIISGAEAV
jgi:F-type H+-transporting ATPase subunit gamma